LTIFVSVLHIYRKQQPSVYSHASTTLETDVITVVPVSDVCVTHSRSPMNSLLM